MDRFCLVVAFSVFAFSLDSALSEAIAIRGESARILFLGDTCFGESYRKTDTRRTGRELLKTQGYDLVIGHRSHLLQEIEHYRGE